MSETRETLMRNAVAMLETAGIDDAARDARLLLRWASGLSGAAFSAATSEEPATAERRRFADAIERRRRREPVSHITGMREFWGRDFRVTADVLDPRPETETIVAEALHRGPCENVLDLGTGSGCLIVTLLSEWSKACGVATDISRSALGIAGLNATRHGVAERILFSESDWFSNVAGTFDLIVSNPPYISGREMRGLAHEVRDYEPELALTPGEDDLDAYRAIAADARKFLRPGGLIIAEFAPNQSEAVGAVFASGGLNVRAIIPDMDLRARAIVAQA